MPSNRTVQSTDDDDPFELSQRVLHCYSGSLRPIASLLSAISFSNRANVEVLQDGLRFDVDIGKTVKAHAYLQSEIFDEYEFNGPPRTTPSPPQTPKRNGTGYSSPSDPFASRTSTRRDDDDDESPLKGRGSGGDTGATSFEISLSTMVEVLDVFGTAGVKRGKAAEREGELGSSDEEGTGNGAGGDESAARGGGYSRWKGKGKAKEGPKASSALRMTWDGEGTPLVLLIEESGTLTRCELQTYEPAAMADITFPHDNRIVKLIMKSGWLTSAMQLFDERSSPDIHLIYNPPPPQPAIYDTPSRRHQPRPKKPKPDGRLPPHHHQAPFRLEAQGTLGSSAMDFPDEREIIDTLEWQDEALDELFVRRRHARFEMSNRGGGGMDVDDEDEAGQDGGRGKMSIRFGYKLAHFAKIKPALLASNKVSLRTDDNGILSLQFMIPFGKAGPQMITNGYVEFICLPLEEEEP